MTGEITLADAIAGLVAEKRAVGYKYVSEERALARFELFCAGEFPGLETVTRASVQAWIAAARRRAVKPATLQSLTAPVRELARWFHRRGVDAYVLPAGVLPEARALRPAHLQRPGARGAVRGDRPVPLLPGGAVPASGDAGPVPHDLRVRAALLGSPAAARRRMSTIENGVLQIRDAKGGKDRQLPVSEPLRERLAGYHAKLAGQPGWEWFFPGATPGVPLTLNNVNRNFRRFLWQARIPHGGRGHGPRVHDLRHTAAVNNLRSWFARRRERRRAAAGPANVPGALVDRRCRLLPAPDRGVLPGHHRPRAADARRHRPTSATGGHGSWRLTSRSACAAS